MSSESSESPSGNMGINWDSRGPALTKNRGCKETYQGSPGYDDCRRGEPERLIKSISICQKELNTLCSELHDKPFQEEGETTILQLEKDLRTQINGINAKTEKGEKTGTSSYFKNKIANSVKFFACPITTLTAPVFPA